MGFKSAVLRPWANQVSKQIEKWSKNALKEQEKILTGLIEKGKHTQFGRDHDFSGIRTYEDFKLRVPIRD
ncbi:MAG: GH3 auxin-responsive promoter family protein, partial [Bacteroidota bacterium]